MYRFITYGPPAHLSEGHLGLQRDRHPPLRAVVLVRVRFLQDGAGLSFWLGRNKWVWLRYYCRAGECRAASLVEKMERGTGSAADALLVLTRGHADLMDAVGRLHAITVIASRTRPSW